MKRIVYTDPATGVLAVLVPAPAERMAGEREDAFAARIAAKDVPQAVQDYVVVEHTDLPASRRFRNAWKRAGAAVTVDATAARGLLLDEVRRERDARLEASDKDKAKLDDIGTAKQKQQLAQYRQSLRDLPATVQAEIAGLDVAGLEAYQPAWPTVAE